MLVMWRGVDVMQPATGRSKRKEKTMFRFNVIKRLPRKPLIGLALLGLALTMGAGAAKQAEAGASTPYQIEVTWNGVKWFEIDDGFGNFDFEVYGTVRATNSSSGVSQVRMVGDTGNPGRCSASDWDGGGPCTKQVGRRLTYNFFETPLSSSTATGQGGINYSFNNNKVFLTVRPGETVRFAVRLFDYDATSANDNACIASASYTLSEAQLQGLHFLSSHTYNDGDANCDVSFTMRRV
jgi:hypothetical protein